MQRKTAVNAGNSLVFMVFKNSCKQSKEIYKKEDI